MASNVSGIAITIRAFLPTGKTLDEQFEALSLVKAAHASGDYSALLEAAKIDEVKTEQKVRRVEDQPAEAELTKEQWAALHKGVSGDGPGAAETPTEIDPRLLKLTDDTRAA
jgi:hypothetical protein